MKLTKRTIHMIGDPMWVNEGERICVVCGETKALKQFDALGTDNGVHVLEQCLLCVEKSRAANVISRRTTVADNLANSLAKLTRRPVKGPDGPALTDFANLMFQKMGGMEDVAETIGQATMTVLKNKGTNPNVAVKYASLVVNMLSVIHKNKDEPLDLSNLNDEDLMDALMEPAKKLLLTDSKFVDQLLSDVTIRRKLLLDLGIDMLEVEGDG